MINQINFISKMMSLIKGKMRTVSPIFYLRLAVDQIPTPLMIATMTIPAIHADV